MDNILRYNMILKTVAFTLPLIFFAACATKSNLQTTQSFESASFEVNDVFVNMSDGIENSSGTRYLMRSAAKNTAKLFNAEMHNFDASYPLEIEVTDVNFRMPNASIASGERTYIEYTATLREEATGEAYRALPVTYYYVAAGNLSTDAAKQNATKNMIRLSIKNTFAQLYGMQEVPQNIQTHFNTQNIFSDQGEPAKKAPKSIEVPVASLPTPTPTSAQAPEVIVSDASIVQTSTVSSSEPVVIKCVVC